MPTITFSEAPSGTTNPIYNSADNVISFTGRIQSDGSNPTSPVLAGSANFQAPIFVSFENLVGSVSLDAGYFDNIGSTVIAFYGANGDVLAVRSNNSTGIITFSFSSDIGIASVSIRATSTELAGFAIDNLTFGAALAEIAPPSLSRGAFLFDSERFLGEVGASSEGVVFIIDEPLSPSDTNDYFNFELAADATLEFTVFWSDDPDSMVTYTFVGEEGINQIRIEAPAGLGEARPYSVWLTDFQSNTNPALDQLEKASKGLELFELSVVDLKQALFDPLKAVVGADAVKAATALNRGLGWLTFGGNLALNTAKYVQMEALGQDWRRELFVDVIDTLAQQALMRGSVAVTAPTGLFALLLAPLALVGSYIVYDSYGQDFVRNFAQSLYDDFDSGGGGAPVLEGAQAAEGDPSVTVFDPDWYLATYADAALAVQSGEYGSAYLHYLAEGAAAGYLPSLGATAIDAATIVNANQPWLNLVPGATTHLQVALGGLSTDGVNNAEAAIVAALNDDRQAALALDGGLSAIANRMAMDLAINSPNGPAVARALDPQGWSQTWSDGLPVQQGPGVTLQSFTNYVVLAAFVTEFESPEDVLAAFYDTSANIGQLQSISYTHVGVAEYGGVWTLVLSSGASGAPLVSETGVQSNVAGSEYADVLVLGTHAGQAAGGAGADTMYGAVGGGNTLDGGDGDDAIYGGQAGYAVESRPDLINGAGATNTTLATALSLDGAFDTDSNANIANASSAPHATVIGTGTGSVRFYGGDGDDFVNGGADADLLDGGNGIDAMNGGDGDDVLYGRNGNDVLDSGLGADTLYGGNDADTFVFSSALGGGNIDTLVFSIAEGDVIQLDLDIFTGIGLGALDANAFVVGSAATAADHRIIYDAVTGALYYDADGDGAGAAVQFATLSPGLALTAANFIGGP